MSRYTETYSFKLKEVLAWIKQWAINIENRQYNLFDNTQAEKAYEEIIGSIQIITSKALLNTAEQVGEQYDDFFINSKAYEWAEFRWIPTSRFKLFLNHFIYRFWESYCCLTYDEDDDTLNYAFNRFWSKVHSIYNFTYDKYGTLLDIYEDKLDKLMNPITSSSSSINKFNDTPQGEGDYSDDEHTTSLYRNIGQVEQDASTPIDRIKEIQNKITNVMLDWTNEYKKLFWEEF